MNGIYCALLKSYHPIVEEEVILEIEKKEFICFASVCPFKITPGKKYLIDLEYDIDDYEVKELKEPAVRMEREGETFVYWASGRLQDGVLHSVLPIEDPILLSDFGYLDGRYIQLRIDRIDVEFLSEGCD